MGSQPCKSTIQARSVQLVVFILRAGAMNTCTALHCILQRDYFDFAFAEPSPGPMRGRQRHTVLVGLTRAVGVHIVRNYFVEREGERQTERQRERKSRNKTWEYQQLIKLFCSASTSKHIELLLYADVTRKARSDSLFASAASEVTLFNVHRPGITQDLSMFGGDPP